MTTRSAWGWGLATVTDEGTVLDTWYPRPQLGEAPADDPYAKPVELAGLERRLDGLERVLPAHDPLDGPARGALEPLDRALHGPVRVRLGLHVGDEHRERGRPLARTALDLLDEQRRRCGAVGHDERPARSR